MKLIFYKNSRVKRLVSDSEAKKLAKNKNIVIVKSKNIIKLNPVASEKNKKFQEKYNKKREKAAQKANIAKKQAALKTKQRLADIAHARAKMAEKREKARKEALNG